MKERMANLLSMQNENDTSKVFRILLPPYENIKAIVNGREAEVSRRR